MSTAGGPKAGNALHHDPGSDAWVVIPARGGSVGVPRKNVRLIAGRPLIVHAIQTAQSAVAADRVIVITDDREIEAIARSAGAVVIYEDQPTPPGETLDTKIIRNLPLLRRMGARDTDPILTVQPTSPLLPASAIVRASEVLSRGESRSAMTVTDDRHLRWGRDEHGENVPLYAARVNRQQLPAELRETGGVIGARLADIEAHQTRVIAPITLIELSAEEAIDIDSFSDLYAAAHLMTRLRIVVRTDAAPELGMGHVYRSMAVATELARHDLRLYTSRHKPLGRRFFDRLPFENREVDGDDEFVAELAAFRPDLVIFDVLDTSAELIDAIRERVPGVRVLTFEDLGTGAARADLVVAEFIPVHEGARRALTGIDNAILAPGFDYVRAPNPLRDAVEHVLVLFGGTDPSRLGERALDALARIGFTGDVTAVRGLGAAPLPEVDRPFRLEVLTDVRHMPSVIGRADLAFTSAGRTVIELATLGVPSIGMAQNEKELTHTHATAANGVLMLGLGSQTEPAVLDDAVRRMVEDSALRRELRESALRAVAGRSNHRTLGRIFDLLGLDPFPNL
ncbi:hypothetical protein [Microbacterium sp. NPDC096154]|uniref:cytidylyltransferase domain-containing protein n=1 Tax=Microbacterium sp. NPDC096154 TaxID=3155549 RepID=UPI00331E8827